MFTKQQKKRYLAIAVALTLGGSLWGSAACTEAADAYTIDAGNPTPDAAHSVPDEGLGPGVAAGFTNAAAPLTGNTLTVDGVTYAGLAYGGYNKGGGVTGNHLIIQNGGRLFYHAGNGGDAYGGRADLGGDARGNTVMIDGGTVDQSVYGGYLSLGNVNGSAAGNRVTIKGAASSIDRNVYGGYIRDSDNTGTVTGNIVTIEDGTAQGEILGGYANSESSVTGNKVFIKGGMVQNAIYGGTSTGGAATDNHVTVTGGTVTAVYGGYSSGGGSAEKNTVTIDGGTVQKWIYGGYIYNGGSAEGNTVTISGGSVQDVFGASVELGNATGNIVTINGGNAQNVFGASVMSGSAAKNIVTINGGSARYVYGGRAEGTGSADGNRVTLTSGTVRSVLGGSAKGTGNANGNTVIITGCDVHAVYGGHAAGPNNNPNNESGNADGNTVDIGAVNVDFVYGGSSQYGTTNNNTIHLRGTRVSGDVVGGSRPNSTGNTLAIHDFGTRVGGFEYVQNLHFYLPEGTTGNSGNTMLTINSPSGQDIRGVHVGVGVAGQRSALQKGDVVSLLKTSRGDLTTDAVLANDVSGMQGVSLRYKFDLQKRSTDELIATVTDAAVMEQTKSLVETRAAASALLNGGADLLSGMGMDAAETAAALPDAATADESNAAIESGSYELWAAQGASGERIETGSYVDAKGWSLNVGFAKRDAIGAGKLTYGPFVEYGRGSYDSYLDDGTHGDGASSYIGGGFMAKVTGANQSYVEASLHAGRIKSDYSGNISGTPTSYDASNSYLAGHIGIGRKFDLGTDAALDGYAKYFCSHQGGTSATLATGEQYDFGSVTSSRVRLGVRYTKKLMPRSEFYAGLAWEYEFDGDATATYQGYATPSPSLKGSSGMLELGYRFAPKEGSVSYGVNLTGWQGKRKGFTGGANVSWAF